VRRASELTEVADKNGVWPQEFHRLSTSPFNANLEVVISCSEVPGGGTEQPEEVSYPAFKRGE
jgi:hypothetical protein